MNSGIAFAVSAFSSCIAASVSAGWTAREVYVEQTVKTAAGAVESVVLGFGDDNGLTNRLYIAYGSADGGDRIGGWERRELLGHVTPETNSFNVTVPPCRYYRFFLDVPFGDGVFGVPLACVVADGTQYLDTGIHIEGGDSVTCRFRPGAGDYGVLGSRYALNEENANIVFMSSCFTFDYNSNPSKSDNYKSYRITSDQKSKGVWYDLTLSSAARSVVSQWSTQINDTACPDSFTCRNSCRLFSVSGSPAASARANGAIASFAVVRGGAAVAEYLPYRFGDEYGFFDRVSGRFLTATAGEFSGEEDAALDTPLTASTVTFMRHAEGVARTVSVVSADATEIRLAFGPANGFTNRLFMACGRSDKGASPHLWDSIVPIADIGEFTDAMTVPVPETGRYCRFFMSLPCAGDVPPVPLTAVTGDGTGYFDTGVKLRGGDTVSTRISPAGGKGAVFGCRSSPNAPFASIAGVVIDDNKSVLDYTDGDLLAYRCMSTKLTPGSWYEFLLSPGERSVTAYPSSVSLGSNEEQNTEEFETSGTCYLFHISRYSTVEGSMFSGSMAFFRVWRDGLRILSCQPCRVGSAVGFYDLIGGRFIEAASGTFTGTDAESATGTLLSVSDVVGINPCGLRVILR